MKNLFASRKPVCIAAEGEDDVPGGGAPGGGAPGGGAPGGDDDPNKGKKGGDYVPASEVAARDKEIADLKAKLAAKTTSTKELDGKIKALEGKLATLNGADPAKIVEELTLLRKAKEDAETKDMDTIQKLEHELKKTRGSMDEMANKHTAREQELMDGATKREKELLDEIGSLRAFKLRAEITNAAVENKAINPAQIVGILESKFTLDAETGEYGFQKTNTKGNITTQTVGEYVKEFLADAVNANLVGVHPPRKGAPGNPAPGSGDPNGSKKPEFGASPMEILNRELTEEEKLRAERRGIDPSQLAFEISAQQKIREKNKAGDASKLLPGEVGYRN